MSDYTNIPEINIGGRFEAVAPFDVLVDTSKYYRAEAIRTIPEMEGLKKNLYQLVYEPAGMSQVTYNTVIRKAKKDGVVIITLIDRFGVATYLPSNYLASFPVRDGYTYERMCLVVDLGPCPRNMSSIMAELRNEIGQLVEATIGISSNVQLGTIPTVTYVSPTQHEINENTRRNKITKVVNNTTKVRDLEEQLIKRDAYIQKLEEQLIGP